VASRTTENVAEENFIMAKSKKTVNVRSQQQRPLVAVPPLAVQTSSRTTRVSVQINVGEIKRPSIGPYIKTPIGVNVGYVSRHDCLTPPKKVKKKRKSKKAARNEQIKELFKQGKSAGEIAYRFTMKERAVRKILERAGIFRRDYPRTNPRH
jgi:hypothetical protein